MPRKYTSDPYYETKEWRELRRSTLQRDKHDCQYCGAKAHQADHVIPRWKAGPDHLNNLVACCRTCNRIAGGSLFVSFAEKKAWLIKRRGIVPEERRAAVPQKKAVGKGVTVKKLTGLRLRLALKHRPPHIIEAELLRNSQSCKS